jgi:hypothetical protein
MSLLNKQNKKVVVKLNGSTDITISNDMAPYKTYVLKTKLEDFIHANLWRALTDDDYILHQIHAIWVRVMGDCDFNDFTAYCEDLDDGEFSIVFSEKLTCSSWRYILEIYIKLDEESYEIYKELT